MPVNSDTSAAQPEQFVRLLGQHERQLVAYILSLVPDWHQAHDIAQETRVRLWQQFAEYDPTKDFGAWARAIAYFLVLQQRTRNNRQPLRMDDDTLALVAAEADVQAAHSDLRQDALAGCLEKLDAPQRRLVAEWYAEGAEHRQIAERTNQAYETVRKKLYRLRLRLHACIEATLRRGEAL